METIKNEGLNDSLQIVPIVPYVPAPDWDGTLCSVLLLILSLFRPKIPIAIPLRPLDPGFNLLTAEESRLARLVVRNAVEIQPAADEFNLRVTRNHPPQFVDVNPILLRAEGAVQDWLSL